jgi:hypothetical protein
MYGGVGRLLLRRKGNKYMKWFRLYNELIDDPKIALMSSDTFKTLIMLMCYASELEQNGKIPESELLISWRLRRDKNDLIRELSELEKLEIISNKSGYYEFNNWGKRQYISDDSSLRMKRHRNRTKFKDVTDQNRADTEQIQSRAEQCNNSNFISNLKEIYTWIDVDTELVKMRGWLSTRKGRRLTQRFAVNWLNKIDKPIKGEIKSW